MSETISRWRSSSFCVGVQNQRDTDGGFYGFLICRGVPAKSEAESARHREEYERMVTALKKKEQRDAKTMRKAEEDRKRQEEALASSVRQWQQDFLPRWEEM